MIRSLIALAALASGDPAKAEKAHTFDGKYDIATIDLTVAYLVPKDRVPLPDWRERVDYYMKRIEAFHTRESSGASRLKITVHPEPLVIAKDSEAIRGEDANATFYNSTREAAEALKWHDRKKAGFPILLVLSEINWREFDDFTRTRMIDGKPTHEGNMSGGRHFPGAESGGARAIYDADRGLGMGLVSADGWRVPYSGSDCVVYHEGIGHPIGLPHPEPEDVSVMCYAQYNYWLNQTWVTPSQKKKLGWDDDGGKVPSRSKSKDLFTAFTALQDPIEPRVGEPVKLALTWPKGSPQVRSLEVRIQTELRGPWVTRPIEAKGEPTANVEIGPFDHATPVSYRVDATLEDGQAVELRGYFQVAPAR